MGNVSRKAIRTGDYTQRVVMGATSSGAGVLGAFTNDHPVTAYITKVELLPTAAAAYNSVNQVIDHAIQSGGSASIPATAAAITISTAAVAATRKTIWTRASGESFSVPAGESILATADPGGTPADAGEGSCLIYTYTLGVNE